MTSLAKRMTRTRRAAVIGLLLAVPLLPLTGCGEGGENGEGGGTELEDGGTEEDDGLY